MLPMKVSERSRVDPPRTIYTTSYGYNGYYDGKWVELSSSDIKGNFNGTFERLWTVDRRGEPPYRRTKQFIRDNGGPFRVDRASFERSQLSVDCWNDARWVFFTQYRGQGMLDTFSVPNSLLPYGVLDANWLRNAAIYAPFANDLSAYGPTAIARMSPLKPRANMGVAVGELWHDGLPHLPGKLLQRCKSLRSAGSEYLNVEFGWLPFLSDLRALYNTWENLDKILSQLYLDNGRPVRRRIVLRNDKSSTSTDVAAYGHRWPWISPPLDESSHPVGYQSPINPIHKLQLSTQITDKIWASGQFRYYIPNLSEDRWPNSAKLALFGLMPTPAMLYQLIPWSWLVDWFSNVGDVLRNLSANGIGDLVIDYAYVMRHQTKVSTYSSHVPKEGFSGRDAPSGTYLDATVPGSFATAKLLLERKERIAASPFGFGLKLGDLSTSQLAILTALGLSRQNFA